MKKTWSVIAALAALALFAGAQDKETTPYTNTSFARISYISGASFVQRSQDLGYEESELNTPLAEGDRIGTTDGRLEIHLGKRIFLRLDQNTKIDFAALPKRDSDLIRIRQWSGHLYLDAGTLTREKQIEILTNDATFYILDPGLYRIDVRPNGETEILVFRGLVEAAGADGSLLVKNANRLILTGGRFQGRPASFFAAAFEDAFDRFNENRASIVNRQFGRRYLPEELSDLEYELDEYGEWTSTDEWGYVWVPRGMASDWRPYYMGHWTWIPFAGWVCGP